MKSVVFVLEELDLFAAKARQTLLYNLLDALQAADIQVPSLAAQSSWVAVVKHCPWYCCALACCWAHMRQHPHQACCPETM